MRIKTSELTGPALRWATAKAVGLEPIIAPPEYGVSSRVEVITYGRRIAYRPECDWKQGGPLIDDHVNLISRDGKGRVYAQCIDEPLHEYGEGETFLIAACRAVVATTFGECVDVPDELCE